MSVRNRSSTVGIGPAAEPSATGVGATRLSPRVDAALLERLASRLTVGDGRREAVPVSAPATGAALGSVPHATEEDVDLAVRRARAAQPAWARVPTRKRAALLLRFHDLLLQRRDEGLDFVQLECGKARIDAVEELIDVANVSRYYGRSSAGHLRPRRRGGGFPIISQAWERHQPVGVVGIIAPWNFPLLLGITDALPALAAGCGVVTKLDVRTPYSALWAASLLDEAGIPPGLLQFVTGSGPKAGPPLVDRVDFVMFTGSTQVGREIAVRCAQRLIGCSLELGGKNAMLVLDDADPERVAEGATRACFSHAGQICVGAERIYVHEALFEEVSRGLAERARAMKLGFGFDYDADMGSLVSAERLDAVSAHVDDALAKGATALAGARPRPDIGPYFYEPTVLAGVTPEMSLFSDETFGPVASVYPVRDEDEAVRLANESPYGLSFSIWTRNPRRGRAVAQALEAGTVNINDGYTAGWSSSGAPMGGVKGSGIGRRHGVHGIEKYTEAQTIAVQRVLRPRWLTHARFARAATRTLRVLRRIPGVR